MLSLALNALVRAVRSGQLRGNDASDVSSSLTSSLCSAEFVQCVVYLASLGTQFSCQWLVKDLEVHATKYKNLSYSLF